MEKLNNQFQVFNKSCENFPEIQNNYIDCIVTSPPYNIKHQYIDYQDDLEENDYLQLIHNVINSARRVLKDDGIFVMDIAEFIIRERNIWFASKFIKNLCLNTGFRFIDWVNYFAIYKDNFYNDVFTGNNGYLQGKNYTHSPIQFILFFSNKQLKERINVKNFKSKYDYSETENEAFWPNLLIKDLVSGLNLKDKNVLDPFMGSGKMGLECLKNNCTFFGYEIERDYHERFKQNASSIYDK